MTTHKRISFSIQDNLPIVIKYDPDAKALAQEAAALRCFAGFGAVDVLSYQEHILTLRRVLPGTSLKSYFPAQEEQSLAIICEVIRNLQKVPLPTSHSFPHISEWLTALDINRTQIPIQILRKARLIRDKLLKTSPADVLLHGDLHHENVLLSVEQGDAFVEPEGISDKRPFSWVVIDPKGVMGDPAYEVGAFIRNPLLELFSQKNVENIIQHRIDYCASSLCMDKNRIWEWCFVQSVLSWVWSIEDNGEEAPFKKAVDFFMAVIF